METGWAVLGQAGPGCTGTASTMAVWCEAELVVVWGITMPGAG